MEAINLDLTLRLGKERRDALRRIARCQQADGFAELSTCVFEGVAMPCQPITTGK